MFRRGKLTFLNTKDDRIRIINERIALTEKHLLGLCTTFAVCTRKMAKQRDAYDELAKGFKSYADDEEVNESLSEGLRNFTSAVTIVGDYMDQSVHRMEMKVVNELAQIENLCKATRDNLRAAVIARDKELLKQRQLIDIKSKFTANNSAADSELLKAKLEVNRANKEIDEIINNFEKRKLANVKEVLDNFILITLKYHTKAVEAMSASYYDVSSINEKSDFLEFQKLMKTTEEAQTRKLALKKGLKKSQSMESLERGQLLSPMKRRSRLTRSHKNLVETDKKESDEEEEDDDEEEEDEEEEEENSAEDDSGTASDTEDTVSEAKEAKKSNLNRQIQKSQHPFKAINGMHSNRQNQPFKPFAAANGNSNGNHNGERKAHKYDNKPPVAASDGAYSRMVTVVESKDKRSSAPGALRGRFGTRAENH